MMIYGGVFLGMSVGFGAILEWTLHGQRVSQPLPPERHWPARARFVGGGLVYVVAILIALVNDVASFVLIARSPCTTSSSAPQLRRSGRLSGRRAGGLTLPRLIVAIKQVSRARLG